MYDNSSEESSSNQDELRDENDVPLSKFQFSKLFAAQDSYHLSKKRLDDLFPYGTASQEGKGLYETQSSTVFLKESANTISISDDEKWLIQSLPIDWVPNTSKSTVLERLNERHRIKHEEAVNIMNQKMIKIHEYIEFGVRLRSQEIKEELENEKLDVVKFSEFVKNSDTQSLDRTLFDIEIENGKSVANENSKKIEEYFEQLSNLEKDRITKIKVVLRETCSCLYQIGYLPPYEIQKFMEKEILRVNQTTLTNFRLYEDICFKLQVQIQTDLQKLILEIGNIRSEWRHRKKELTLQNLVSSAEESKSEVENTSKNDPEKSLHSVPDNDSGDKIIFKIPSLIRNDSSFQSIQNMGEELQAVVEDLDNIAHDLVNLYANTLQMVFNKFYVSTTEYTNKINSFANIVVTEEEESHLSLYSCTNEQYIEGIIKTAQEPLEISFEEVLFIWNTVIDQLHQKLQETYAFVNDSCELWDTHRNRVEANQDAVCQYLASAYKAHDTTDLVYENKLNAKMDELRDASTEIELEKNYIKVQELLKHKEAVLRDNYQKEIDISKKYKELSLVETKVILSEIEEFFETHKRKAAYGPNERITSKIPEHIVIPKQLKICDIKIASIANWRKGLSETIENFKNKGVEQSNQHVKEWLDEISKNIEERLNLKLLYHNERFDRIKNGIYKDRLLELRVHFDRYQSHISAFHTILQKLSITISEIQNRDKALITAYHKDVVKMLQRIAKVNTRVEMTQITLEIEGMKTKAKDIIKHFEHSFITRLNQCQDQAKQSNMKYLESIKMFSNGGNYSTDEAKTYLNYLNETEFEINDDVKILKDNVTRFISNVKKKLRQYLRHLYKSAEKYSFEVTFIDKVLHILNNLQDEIKHAAYEIKTQANRITSTIDNIIESLNQLCDDNLPTETTIQHLINRIQKLISDIENLTKFLQQQDAMLDVQLPLFLTKKETSPSRSSKSDKRSSKVKLVKCRRCTPKTVVKNWCRYTSKAKLFASKFMARKKDTFLPTDFRSVLFSWMPSRDSKKFIGHICYLVFEAFTTLQSYAFKFYKAKFNSTIMRKDLIQPNYEAFMREILYKCKYYHIQCEELWLSIVRDVVNKIGDLKNCFLKYSNLVIEKYGSKYLTDLNNIQSKFKEDSGKDLIYREKNWYHTRNQLKTLHGFPENHQLLHRLNTDVMACIMDVHRNPWYLKETNTFMSQLASDFTTEIDVIHNKLCELLKNLFNEPHTSNLMAQMYKLLEDKKEGEIDRAYGRPQLIVPEEYRINVGLGSKHQLLLSHAIVDYEKIKIQKLLNDLKKEEEKFKFESKLMDTISMLDSKCGLIDDGSELNITREKARICNLFLDKINLLNSEIENEKALLRQETDSWIENWVFDMEQIIKLYELPYT